MRHLLLLSPLALAGCTSGIGLGGGGDATPAGVAQTVGGAIQTVGTFTGNPLLMAIGAFAQEILPYVLTGGVAAVLGKRGAVKAEKARPFTDAEMAEIRKALEAPKA